MRRLFSSRMRDDLAQSFQDELSRNRIINISALAEQIRRRNEAENVALEDISEWLIHYAKGANAAIVFDGAARD